MIRKTVLVFSSVVFVGICLAFLLSPYSDFQVFWAAARALSNGVNPYDGEAFRSFQESLGFGVSIPFTYPLWLAVLFVPLAALPVDVARWLWAGLSLMALLQTVRALNLLFPTSVSSNRVALVGCAVMLFWPISLGLGLGQVSQVVLFLLVFGYAAYRREQMIMAGVSFALASSKPHLVVLPVLGLLFGSLVARQWRLGISYLVTVSGLTALGLSFRRDWVGDWLSSIGDVRTGDLGAKYFASLNKLFSVLEIPYGNLAGITLSLVGMTLVLALFTMSARDAQRRDRLFALAPAVTVLLLPYTLNYDFVMLLVPIFYILSKIDLPARFRVAACVAIFLLPWLLLSATIIRGFDRAFDAILPLTLIALALAPHMPRLRGRVLSP